VPSDPVSIAVALADKIDTLALFFWMKEFPTGSKDPFALRRAAIGAIRLIIDNQLRLSLSQVCEDAIWATISDWDNQYRSVLLVSDLVDGEDEDSDGKKLKGRYFEHIRSPDALAQFRLREEFTSIAFTWGDEQGGDGSEYQGPMWDGARLGFADPFITIDNLLSFFADRLKVQLREQGARHDLVDAVFSLSSTSPSRGEVAARSGTGGGGSSQKDHPTPSLRDDPPPQGDGEQEPQRQFQGEGAMQDDLLMIVRRVEALGKLLDTDDGRNLLAGTKRASNILAIEEKKDKRSFDGAPDVSLYKLDEEKKLATAIDDVKREAGTAVANEDFAAAMSAMAKLRPAVDAFFEKVKVNDADPKIRENRLRLLNEIRAATRTVADFSKIQD